MSKPLAARGERRRCSGIATERATDLSFRFSWRHRSRSVRGSRLTADLVSRSVVPVRGAYGDNSLPFINATQNCS